MSESPQSNTPALWIKLAPLLALVVVLVSFFALGVDTLISLEALRQHHQVVAGFADQRPLLTVLCYVGLYALLVAAGLPVGIVMMVGAGYLFGIPMGTSLAVLAATLGGLLMWASVRRAGADWIEQRVPRRLVGLRSHLKRHEMHWMVLLRLVPVFPFFSVTLAAVAAGVSWRAFAIGTALGIVPVNFAWAALGSNLESWLARGAIGLSDLVRADILVPAAVLVGLVLSPLLVPRLRPSPDS